MIRATTRRSGKKTEESLRKITRGDIYAELDRFGKEGVAALAAATPVDSGLTAQSWTYRVHKGKRPGIEWYNTNEVNGHGIPIVILIQYGHATRGGGYVQGRDFINPAIKPIFDKIADNVWKKVRNG